MARARTGPEPVRRKAGVLGAIALTLALAAGCDDPARPTDGHVGYEFWALDCNGDERLSADELKAFTWNRAFEGIETPLRPEEFGGADADDDGYLTLNEYTALINKDGHYHHSPRGNCH
jgi:hypothetical protein